MSLPPANRHNRNDEVVVEAEGCVAGPADEILAISENRCLRCMTADWPLLDLPAKRKAPAGIDTAAIPQGSYSTFAGATSTLRGRMKTGRGWDFYGTVAVTSGNPGTNRGMLNSDGPIWSGTGLLVASNTRASIPALNRGDVYLWSSNGVAYIICSSPSGVLTTNKLAP